MNKKIACLMTLAGLAVSPVALCAETTDMAAPADLPPPVKKLVKKTSGFRPSLKYGVDNLSLEAGYLPDASEAKSYSSLNTSVYALWQPSREWEFRAGARLDAMSQTGNVDHHEALLDYTDTYARYRNGDARVTLGAQTIIWGRVDDIAPSDKVSRVDLTRFILDNLSDRRRAQLAARLEYSLNEYKIDLVALPLFRSAQMPDPSSVWSPVNRSTGQIIGFAPNAALVSTAQIQDDEHGSGGGGARLTHNGDSIDWGMTLSRTRYSLPYYRIIPGSPAKLIGEHPYSNYAGGDAAIKLGNAIVRVEAGYDSDAPVTTTGLALDSVPALNWVGGVEMFPGGGNTRLNLQLFGRKLMTSAAIFDMDEYYGVNGQLETELDQGRWKAGLRFNAGLNIHDVYVNPSIRYIGWEPNELSLGVHYFDGNEQTIGGFQKDHSMVTLGFKTRF